MILAILLIRHSLCHIERYSWLRFSKILEFQYGKNHIGRLQFKVTIQAVEYDERDRSKHKLSSVPIDKGKKLSRFL